jgi:mRNA interferase MazF
MIRRGDIHSVDLAPVRGSEANERRPAVILSNYAANTTADRLRRGVVTVVPVTSHVARIFPFQVALPAEATGLARDSKAQAEQIRSIAVERIGGRLGVVPARLMEDLEDSIRLQLGL